MTAVELWILGKLLDAATSPAAKSYLVSELKQFDSAATNPFLKVVIEALERFLASGLIT